MKIIGVIPARMASNRFPGKPLFPICGKPMLEHVYERAKMYDKWDGLYMATCDQEIMDFSADRGYPALMTSDKHTRALDRVAEAAEICGLGPEEDDIVVCVQGDEPMIRPDMIEAAVRPLEEDPAVTSTVLTMEITDEGVFRNPDTVKAVFDLEGNVLYTSRSPIPYCETLTDEVKAYRIYGILAFRWRFLKWFNTVPESPLEIAESCDSNRICDNGGGQRVALYPHIPMVSVDSPGDCERAEREIVNDPLWGTY
jgi:3-deoxy-manno-octulosonate cytidylyltransferase (CMP-KDO synthetase)